MYLRAIRRSSPYTSGMSLPGADASPLRHASRRRVISELESCIPFGSLSEASPRRVLLAWNESSCPTAEGASIARGGCLRASPWSLYNASTRGVAGMNPERWQRIGEVLSAALECEEQQRASFLAKACEGDDEL